MLVTETGVKARMIDDVRVMEDFSFVTVPYLEAEHILHAFKSRKVKGNAVHLLVRGREDFLGGRGRLFCYWMSSNCFYKYYCI